MISRRQILKSAAIATVGSGAGLGYYVWRVAPHSIETTQFKMPLRGLPDRWDGRRLVQISDLHVGPVVDSRYLERAIELTNSYQGDIVVVTGDLMTCVADEAIDDTVELVRRLKPDRQPVVVTLGNHDYGRRIATSTIGPLLLERLRGIGCVTLLNQGIELDGLQIGGTNDLWTRRASLVGTAQQLDPSRDAILLTHNPDIVDFRAIELFEGWILSGHTHGGQCRFPGIGPPILPIHNHDYAAGMIRLADHRTLYVNRGLGYARRVRFRCSPEITLFTLAKA